MLISLLVLIILVFSNGMFSLFTLLVLAIQIIAYEILLNIMVDLCFSALISNNLVVFGWDLQEI